MSSIVSPVSGMTQKFAEADLQRKEADAAEAAKVDAARKRKAELLGMDAAEVAARKEAPRGRAATMLTGSMGVMGLAPTAKKTLMGM